MCLRELICSTVTEEHKLDRFPNVLQLVCNTTDACIYIRITWKGEQARTADVIEGIIWGAFGSTAENWQSRIG